VNGVVLIEKNGSALYKIDPSEKLARKADEVVYNSKNDSSLKIFVPNSSLHYTGCGVHPNRTTTRSWGILIFSEFFYEINLQPLLDLGFVAKGTTATHFMSNV